MIAGAGRCCAPGSLGRHVLGEPDWAGRQICDCGIWRSFPPGTFGLPAGDPELAALLSAIDRKPILTLGRLLVELLPERRR